MRLAVGLTVFTTRDPVNSKASAWLGANAALRISSTHNRGTACVPPRPRASFPFNREPIYDRFTVAPCPPSESCSLHSSILPRNLADLRLVVPDCGNFNRDPK